MENKQIPKIGLGIGPGRGSAAYHLLCDLQQFGCEQGFSRDHCIRDQLGGVCGGNHPFRDHVD